MDINSIVSFMEQNYQLFVLIPTILFVFIILFWTLVGFIRGFRCSLFRLGIMFISLACAIGVFFILSNDGGKLLYQISAGFIDYGESLEIDTTNVHNFFDVVEQVIIKQVEAESGVGSVAIELMPQINAYSDMAVNVVSFVVSFVIYFIVIILLSIFYLLFFREGKYRAKARRLGYPYKKRKILGGLIGLLRGTVVGLFTLSLIGIFFYSATGLKTKNTEVTFKDQTFSDYYDLNNAVRGIGNEGIFKILNQYRDSNNVPYYLFMVDAIFSGDIVVDGKVTGTVYLSHELASITGVANDLIDLIGKYGGADLTMDVIDSPTSEEALNTLDKLFSNENFNTELTNIIDKYEGTEYIKNFMKLTIAALANNVDQFVEDESTLGFYYYVFGDSKDPNYNPNNYILPQDLLTFNDCKTLLLAVINSIPNAIDLYQYASIDDDGEKGFAEVAVHITNKSLHTVKSFYDKAKEISVFEDGTAKNKNVNLMINRTIDYSLINFVKISNDEGVEEPIITEPLYGTTYVDWTKEFGDVIETSDSMVDLTAICMDEYDNQPENDKSMSNALTYVFGENYPEKNAVDADYNQIVDAASRLDSVDILLNSEVTYNVLESTISTFMAVDEVKIPRDINFSDRLDANGNILEKGELRILLEEFRTLIGKGITSYVSRDLSNLNVVRELLNLFGENVSKDSEETVLDSALESKVIYYTLSACMIASGNSSNELFRNIYVPKQARINHAYILNEEEISVEVVSKAELIQMYDSFRLMMNEIDDLNELTSNPLRMVEVLKDEEVKESVLESSILAATISRFTESNVLSSPSYQDMFSVPMYLSFDNEDEDETILNNWIKEDGELDNLLNALNYVDIDSLATGNQKAIHEFTTLEENEVNELCKSNIIHYSFGGILTKQISNDSFKVVVPKDCYTDDPLIEGNNLDYLATKEIYNMLHAASYVIIYDEKEESISYDLNQISLNKEEVLSSTIFHATMVNSLVEASLDEGMANTLVIPTIYQEVNYDKFKESNWYINKEVNKVLTSIDVLEINLNDILNGEINMDTFLTKVLGLDEPSLEDPNRSKIEVICDSLIMSRSLTNAVMTNENTKEQVVVPTNALDSSLSNENDTYISSIEWEVLISGIKTAFELESDDNILDVFNEEGLSKNVNVFFTNENDEEYQNKKKSLFNSFILEASMVKNVQTELSKDTNNVVVPVFMINEDSEGLWKAKRANNSYTILENNYGELGNLLDSFNVTGLGTYYGTDEFNQKSEEMMSVESVLINSKDNNESIDSKLKKQAIFLKSYLISTTIISKIIPLDDGENPALVIPDEYDYESTEDLEQKLTLDSPWFTSKEINKIMDAINQLQLDITNNSVTMSVSVVLKLNDELLYKVDVEVAKRAYVVNKSDILSQTMTKQVKDHSTENNGKMVIPTDVYDDRNTITSSEFVSAVDSLEQLGADQDTNLYMDEPTILVKNLFAGTENEYLARREKVLQSKIIEYTMVSETYNTILDSENDDNNIIMPNILSNNNMPSDDYWYLNNNKDSELTSLLDVIYELKLGDSFGEENFGTLLNDNIKATNIFYQEEDSELDKQAKADLQNKLLQSDVLKASLISTIISLSEEDNLIDIPSALNDSKENIKTNYGENYNWIISKELNNIFTSLNELSLPVDNESFNFDINKVVLKDYEMDNLLVSKSIWLTITNRLKTSGLYLLSSDLKEDDLFKNQAELYLSNTEIDNTLKALKIVSTNDEINLSEIKVSNIFGDNYETNRNTILSSNTLSLTIVDILQDAFNKTSENTTNYQTTAFIPKDLKVEFDDNKVIENNEIIDRWLGNSESTNFDNELYSLFTIIKRNNWANLIDSRSPIVINVNEYVGSDNIVIDNRNVLLTSLIMNATLTKALYTIGKVEEQYQNEINQVINLEEYYLATNWHQDNKLKSTLTNLQF